MACFSVDHYSFLVAILDSRVPGLLEAAEKWELFPEFFKLTSCSPTAMSAPTCQHRRLKKISYKQFLKS
jgi:hypothetical protein